MGKKDYIKIIEAHPLEHNKALCFDLMVELGISVFFMECPSGTGRDYYATRDRQQTLYCGTPTEAVELAVREVYE